MDPYTTESELLTLHSTFHQGQHAEAATLDISSLSSPASALAARVLQLRARIALGEADAVLAEVKGSSEPELQAVGALALLALGKEGEAVGVVEGLVAGEEEREGVLVVAGIVLSAAGRAEEALGVLGRHQGSLDAVALIVQIYLQQNRTDLAVKEVAAARRWAQDSLLVNLAESWVGLRLGGEKYQQAFYVFEELAQAPATSSAQSLISQAVAELHLGRLEEAQAALDEALKKGSEYAADAIANQLVLSVISGKGSGEWLSTLQNTDAQHPLLTDLAEKSELFDKAATKYKAKVAAA